MHLYRWVATKQVPTIANLREFHRLYSVYKRKEERECISRWIFRFANVLNVDAQDYQGDYVSSSSSSSDEDDEDEAEEDNEPLASAMSVYVDMTEPLVPGAEDPEEEYVTEDHDLLYEE